MTTEEGLSFLQRHQPMPSDWDITDEQGAAFMQILAHFEHHPDDRCLPLLVGSVSGETGLGMYEHIKFVFMAYEKVAVVPALRVGLRDGNNGTKYRCCWWAADISAWELEGEIAPLVEDQDTDTQEAAYAFLDLKAERGAV